MVFDGKARIDPGGAEAAAVTIRRAHWNVTGAFVDLGQSTGPGIALEAGATDVTLNQSRISGGAGPGILVGGETDRIRIGNSRIAKSGLEKAQPEAVGIVIEAGARNTLIANNRLKENPGGSIRVRAPAAGGRAAGGLRLLGNTLRDDAATGIEVEAADGIRIASNTISDSPTWTGTRGIVLGRVNDAVVQWNHISDRAIGVQVGEVAAEGDVRQAAKVSIDNNYIADTFSAGTGVRIEAARDARVVHNVLDRVAQAFLVLGAPPQTERVTVSNNLALGVAALAFALDDPKAAALFDHNVFSPSAGSLNARVGERETSLATFLKGKTMPYTKLVPGVRILNRDLARIEGVQTRDIGLKEQ